MTQRLDRIGPLIGVLAALLGIAGFGTARPGPGPTSQGSEVIAFYTKHASGQRIADTLLMLSGACLVVFAAYVCRHLKVVTEAEPFASAALVGAGVAAAGMGIYFGADYTLASDPGNLAPAAAQALNMLGLKLFFAASAGVLVFGVTVGIAILRGGRLPKWLGIAAVLIGAVAATPLTLAALFALLVWSAITGAILTRRSNEEVGAPGATTF